MQKKSSRFQISIKLILNLLLARGVKGQEIGHQVEIGSAQVVPEFEIGQLRVQPQAACAEQQARSQDGQSQ